MNKATFDPARRLDLYFRCARDGSKDFVFTYSDGTPYSFIYEEFQFYIYRYQGEKKVLLELLTVSNQDTLTSSITVAQSNIDAAEYYYELFNSQTNETWLCGDAIFHNGKFDGVSTDTENVTIQINGEEINITLEVTPANAADSTPGLTDVLIVSPAAGFIKIEDLGTPTAAADAATKGYADLKRTILYKNNVSSSLTGTTNETIMDSYTIPVGTIEANDIINIVVETTKAGTANALAIKPRLILGSTAIIAGSSQLGLFNMAAANLYSKISREIKLKNSLASQEGAPATISSISDYTVFNAGIASYTHDFSLAQTIFITHQLSSAADTATLRSWFVERIRS